jgi:hypothetical protein
MANREISLDQIEQFLDLLVKTVNVSFAAKTVGISRAGVYKKRKQDPDFARLWDEAIEEGLDLLELEAQRRAFSGVEEPVYYKGKVVGHVKKYSDSLTQFLLRAHRPHKFGQGLTRKTEFTLTTTGDVRAQIKADITDYNQLRIAASEVRQIIEGECEPVSED